MDDLISVGKGIERKDAWDKVTGKARYTGDFLTPGMLYVRVVISTFAHAKIKAIDTSEAKNVSGVRAILTGKNCPFLVGSTIEDMPPLAIDKVRHYGEPVAMVVAENEFEASMASSLIKVDYEPLPVVNSPREGVTSDAPLVHENLGNYRILEIAKPVPGTNIANRNKIRKGDINQGFRESDVISETEISFTQSDHAAMETRCATCEIDSDGYVTIWSSSQSPFVIKEMISLYFGIPPGKIIVNVPYVGGAYGGKTPVQLEILAYLASKEVGGRKVRIRNTREDDMVMSPVHIGLDAKVKLGAKNNGQIVAAEITYLFDGGAFADRAVIMSRAAAVDCTGPYRIDNVWCDSLCVYTNHPYATAFRGFSHCELTFAVERAMDELAEKLNMDPLKLRCLNAITYGDTTPTRTVLNQNNTGNLPECIDRLKRLINWDEGYISVIGDKVRAKGISCFWKTSNTPTDCGAGAIITINPDASVNLNCGAVEIGQGTKTILSQILAERMKMSADKVHVVIDINTQTTPSIWKTAASTNTMMVGKAVLRAADDAICQLLETASIALRIPADDLELGGGRVFLKGLPELGIDIKEIAFGYTYPNGNTVRSQVIGRGSYVFRNLTFLDPETGAGTPGPEWTVGAQAVEVEFDRKTFTYKILKSASVIDAGKVINIKTATGQITGGMAMGLSFASRENFSFTKEGIIQNPVLRTYKVLRYGEQPEFLVDFVETPKSDSPYGARGIGEYGVIGMPAALANSLSAASKVHLDFLPLVPEAIWKAKGGMTK
jgi:CO/xanthine dehydrogenase Mo-binding subunit